MNRFQPFTFPYPCNHLYQKKVAYFSMEFALHQPLKTYAGGLGFLAGSHMRSAYALNQHVVGIGILWKYGYYDQVRRADQSMDVLFQEKVYGFLQETGIRFTVPVNHSQVTVTAYYLAPEVFGTAPIFLLSTDLPENDYLAQTISHRLYDASTEARIAAGILLGTGGARLLEELQYEPDVYHLNEAHGLPLVFHLYGRYRDAAEVEKRLVFTNHTPEESGNHKTDIYLLERMSYFAHLPLPEVRRITGNTGEVFDHTLAALTLARVSNGVSRMHGEVMRKMWEGYTDIGPLTSITNAQNHAYWADPELDQALRAGDDPALIRRKKALKRILFEEVADQTGEIYDENILTIVWARRFAGYKRADLILQDYERFLRFVTNTQRPVQIIWAGKPYPMDYTGISVFNRLVYMAKEHPNCSVLVGYEMKLSRMLKQGADVWLNTPRITHEASGTSGMTAAMNGAVNVSIPDGWLPEFARHGQNCFITQPVDPELPLHQQDELDADRILDLLEKVVLPMYYEQPEQWLKIIKTGMQDIQPDFDSDRLAREYYDKLYSAAGDPHYPEKLDSALFY
jgi:glycogen phosphorylase